MATLELIVVFISVIGSFSLTWMFYKDDYRDFFKF